MTRIQRLARQRQAVAEPARYSIGIGRAGFEWSGRAHIAYEKWRYGRPPGNPLGARALYIHQGHRDTLYRIHGTGEAWRIGKAILSGCVRLLHRDVIHLYDHVRSGSAIVLMRSDGAAAV